MTGKTVLVTGAGGYIGSFVVRELLDLGLNVKAIDRNVSSIDSRAQLIDYNIFDGKSSVFQDLGKPDVLIHLAWRDGFVHNSPAHLENLNAHFNFLKSMVDGGLKHLLVMGTMHEVGYHEGEIDEETPTNPYSMYGVSKNALRQSLEIYLRDKDTVFQWLRAFYIFGDDVRSKSIFSKLIQANKEGKKTFPFNSGRNKYDFILVKKLAKQIALTSLQTEVRGIINCCSGEPVALGDVVEKFIQDNNLKIELNYGVYPDRPYDSPAIWGNNEKIKAIVENFNRQFV
ncbi:NAD(P)-dependent oxidoreductase [Paenibacillus polysaccharolyticus]|uniref:NAD-dependent epimerase/dehydratase family protein n=1 Tax=Paenibacillus polysaccharolyticus TaxID=582692 RepID=UPI00209F9BE8|nr:NAD(P)-dependent oxidoreductase [Paenibacillus polysaccharolyticus]MCP1137542.1 NAD(P)-dependent oxidoreductase [Paenibacillus polysaccharolyticus]